MNFDSIIQKNVDMAFGIIESLVTLVTFNTKDTIEFDFAGAVPVVENMADLEGVEAVVQKSKKESSEFLYKELLTKSINIDMYDKVTIDGEQWTIGQPIYDDGYTQLLEIFRSR